MPGPSAPDPKPRFFADAAEWRAWLDRNHTTKTSLLVGMRPAKAGGAAMSWSQSVDEALSFGWIDGVRKSLGKEGYTIRFSVRKKRSIWSRVNIAKAESLIAEGKMRPAGLAAYRLRSAGRSKIYSYEQRVAELDPEAAAKFRANAAAWAFFENQAPSYRKRIAWWIVSAKRVPTRQARLARAIDLSSRRKTL